tara:strand:+ start:942 stop:1070 length:129 start_codon:yes stop_codon:yes gene_type:complete
MSNTFYEIMKKENVTNGIKVTILQGEILELKEEIKQLKKQIF